MVKVVFETGDTYTVPAGVTVHRAAQHILEEEKPVGETKTILEIIDALGNAAEEDAANSSYTILVNGNPVPPDMNLSEARCTVAIRRQ